MKVYPYNSIGGKCITNKYSWDTWIEICKRVTWIRTLYHIKQSLKITQRFKCKTKKYKTQKRKYMTKSLWTWMWQCILRHDIRSLISEREIDKFDFIKLKNICISKGHITLSRKWKHIQQNRRIYLQFFPFINLFLLR